MRRNMAASENVINENSLKANQPIFLFCDQCLWTVTCLNKIYLQEISQTNYICPACNQDELSSFPVSPNDAFTYNYSDKRGLELTFGIKK